MSPSSARQSATFCRFVCLTKCGFAMVARSPLARVRSDIGGCNPTFILHPFRWFYLPTNVGAIAYSLREMRWSSENKYHPPSPRRATARVAPTHVMYEWRMTVRFVPFPRLQLSVQSPPTVVGDDVTVCKANDASRIRTPLIIPTATYGTCAFYP